MSLLIRSVILSTFIFVLVAAPSVAQEDKEDCRRREITIVPYKAATTEAEQKVLKDFQDLMIRSLSHKGGEIFKHLMEMDEADQGARIEQLIEYLIDIRRADWKEDEEDSEWKKLLRALSFLKIRKFVDTKAQLAVLEGAVSEKDKQILFDSTIHVGRKRDLFEDERFNVEFSGDPNDIDRFEEAHEFYFLYALAKDALRDDCDPLPIWIKREILKEANSAVRNLDENIREKHSRILK